MHNKVLHGTLKVLIHQKILILNLKWYNQTQGWTTVIYFISSTSLKDIKCWEFVDMQLFAIVPQLPAINSSYLEKS